MFMDRMLFLTPIKMLKELWTRPSFSIQLDQTSTDIWRKIYIRGCLTSVTIRPFFLFYFFLSSWVYFSCRVNEAFQSSVLPPLLCIQTSSFETARRQQCKTDYFQLGSDFLPCWPASGHYGVTWVVYFLFTFIADRSIFLLWPWTMTDDPDRRIWLKEDPDTETDRWQT